MNQYQSIGGNKGSSRSQEKWSAMKLTDLTGKKVLDLGCNEGFFTEKALEIGASLAVGVDLDATLLERARERVEKAAFVNSDWEAFLNRDNSAASQNLPVEYDVIFMISALHYSDNYSGTLERVWRSLSDDGFLILEASIGSAVGSYDGFVPVTRGKEPFTDTVFHFTPKKFLNIAKSKFFVRYIGPSPAQPGDPIPRHFYKLYKRKQFVLLIGGRSGAGKTALTSSLCESNGNYNSISLDEILINIASGEYTKVGRFLKSIFEPGRIDLANKKLIESDFLNEFIEYVLRCMDEPLNFIVEGELLNYQEFEIPLALALKEKGFLVRKVSQF